MRFLFLDTETTNDDDRCRMIQVAYRSDDGAIAGSAMFKPPVPIEIGAMAVHHITEDMVKDCEPFAGSETEKVLTEALKTHILVAHNAKFDKGVLEREGLTVPRWICTFKNAARLWPDLQQHKMQFLRYLFNLQIDTEHFAHDARADIAVLEPLFYEELKALSVELPDTKPETLIEILEETSQQPILLRIAKFGKHKGMTFEQIKKTDPGWMRWLLGQADIDEDLRFTLEYWLRMP